MITRPPQVCTRSVITPIPRLLVAQEGFRRTRAHRQRQGRGQSVLECSSRRCVTAQGTGLRTYRTASSAPLVSKVSVPSSPPLPCAFASDLPRSRLFSNSAPIRGVAPAGVTRGLIHNGDSVPSLSGKVGKPVDRNGYGADVGRFAWRPEVRSRTSSGNFFSFHQQRQQPAFSPPLDLFFSFGGATSCTGPIPFSRRIPSALLPWTRSNLGR